MRIIRSALLVPIILVALLGAVLGFVVTRELAPQGSADGARVSVLTLPSTPTPSPTPEPTPTDTPDASEEEGTSSSGRGRGGGDGEGRGSCPVGCTCEARPPSGVVIRCTGS